jgi:hypothetical protein
MDTMNDDLIDPVIAPLVQSEISLSAWLDTLPDALRVAQSSEVHFDNQAELADIMTILFDIKDRPEIQGGVYSELGRGDILRLLTRTVAAAKDDGDMADVAITGLARTFAPIKPVVDDLRRGVGLMLKDILIHDPGFIRAVAAAMPEPRPQLDLVSMNFKA